MATFAKEILELIGALEGLRLSIYIDTASYAVFVYDYLLTFEDERTYMWSKKWCFMKTLFFMVRYLPIVDLTITAIHHFRTDLSPRSCSYAFKSAAWLINLGIVTAELILLVRTHAIWQRKKWMLVVLVAWGLANLIADITIMAFFLNSIGFSALPRGLSGCLVTSGNSLLRWVWITLMVYESGKHLSYFKKPSIKTSCLAIIALLLYKGYQMYKDDKNVGGTSLYRALFRDGAIFYVYIFALSVANVIVITTLSRDKSKLGMLASLERVTHSVLTGRLLLALHQAGSERKDDGFEVTEPIQFKSGPTGRRAMDGDAGVTTSTFDSSDGIERC